MSESGFLLRAARPADAPALLGLIRELAVYERLEHLVEATPERLAEQLFGARPAAEALLAEVEGRVVGFALYFHNFSTFLAKPGLYLEDLYVQPAQRGRGIGKALLKQLAALAIERGCGRFEWSVLDWNAPAIGFYRRIGAVGMDEWTVQRLEGAALHALAARDEL